MQQKLRLYFPLITARQLIIGVNTAYSQEITKLRKLGISNIQPFLSRLKFRKYPYRIYFIFYTADEIDMISLFTISSYILHLFEKNVVLQSTDYRVVPSINVSVQKINTPEKEGCDIILEKYIKQASYTGK